jgi:hypothetical protein
MKHSHRKRSNHQSWQSFVLFAANASLSGCASSTPEPLVTEYHAPIGDFSCSDSRHGLTVEEHLGPDGGTFYINRYVYRTRIDVQKLDLSGLKILGDEVSIAAIHDVYLDNVLVPLIRSGVPDAEILNRDHRTVDGRPILFSAVSIPGGGVYIGADGNRRDGVRCQIQVANSRFVYTISSNHTVVDWAEWDGQKILGCYDLLYEKFRICDFPE